MATWSLSWIEYSVVAVTLAGTILVGFFFRKSSRRSLDDYMFGGRKMSVFPICMSITATLLTGNGIVTSSTENYLYGSQMIVAGTLGMILGSVFAIFFYIPVLRGLKSVSPYEYFDRRYNKHVRTFVSAISILDSFIILSLYVPALTFSQVCGLSMFTVACILSFTCLIYTVLGGLKAVAWADSFQMIIMTFCIIVITTVGLYKSGGLMEVAKVNKEGYRLELFNPDLSPFQRMTLLSGLGIFFLWAPYFFSPTQHQRYLSVPKESQVKKVVAWSSALIIFLMCFNYSIGLLAYARFAGCDPVLGKLGPKSYSGIIPYYISDIAENLPGVTGLFHAGMIAAGLSTTTSLWNTLSCTIFEDLIRPFVKNDLPETTAYKIILALVVVIGVVTTFCTYLLQYLGDLLEVTVITRATTQSVMFVLFNVGMFLPWINAKGLASGGIGAACTTVVLLVGSIQAKKAGLTKDVPKFLTTEECPGAVLAALGNSTLTLGFRGNPYSSIANESVFWFFKLSVYLYQVPGIIVGMTTAIVVSFLTGATDLAKVDPAMIVPQMRWLLKAKSTKENSGSEGVPLKGCCEDDRC